MTVKVQSTLCNQIRKIMESGEVDMNDSDAVLEYARANALGDLERMITGNSSRYLRCISDGMEPIG